MFVAARAAVVRSRALGAAAAARAGAARPAAVQLAVNQGTRWGGVRGLSGAKKTVRLTFVDADGDSETINAEVGSSMLDVAHDNDIEVEGACGGEMACSTCHMIFDEATYASLPEKEEEEEDMLDLALGLTDTSRLGCQVIVTEAMDGITIKLPAETSSML